jgi:hypothetical protein
VNTGVHVWQNKKRVATILMHHKEDMHSKVNKANKEETKPAVVYGYNQAMGAIHLKDQMLQPHLLQPKEGSKWYMKLFKMLLNIAIHNTMII